MDRNSIVRNDSSSFASLFSTSPSQPMGSPTRVSQRFRHRPTSNTKESLSFVSTGLDSHEFMTPAKRNVKNSPQKTELWEPISDSKGTHFSPKKPRFGSGNSLKTNDIAGAKPKALGSPSNKPALALRTNDIEGASPKLFKGLLKPQSPNVQVPLPFKPIKNQTESSISFKANDPPSQTPKNLRNSIATLVFLRLIELRKMGEKDIEGAQPKKTKKGSHNRTTSTADIPGAQPKKPKVKEVPMEEKQPVKKRHVRQMSAVDSLDPVYTLQYASGE